ncbi:hypothetical protein [Paenibacillus methanolicus]|uniref:Uncharacterized protein n=1 Tax=Paenibacillus methanolicus TaxID=582686 RepID=A0A5S5BZD7_9BACL|nr:hypothetical protein [Paenibacillus methanolicus]TYP72424.1 hypothetical protein BCM02_10878 [Paenibacillus methanolicus]
MTNSGFYREGLEIIARCKKETGDIWAAHYGAAAIAGTAFASDNALTDAIRSLVSDQADRMLAGHRDGRLLPSGDERLPEARFGPGARQYIVEALEETIDELRWVGHNVIYGAVSLLAMHRLEQHGQLCRPSHESAPNVRGSVREAAGIAIGADIADLILAFRKAIPGRSWIGASTAEVKRIELTADLARLRLASPEELSDWVLGELAAFHAIYRAEAHHDLIGHLLTFSHGLNLLHDLGYVALFRRGQVPLLRLVQVLRLSRDLQEKGTEPKLYSPVDRLPLHRAERSASLPAEQRFWERDYNACDWDFGHVFKFSWSFYDHWRRGARSLYREAATENFRYIIRVCDPAEV